MYIIKSDLSWASISEKAAEVHIFSLNDDDYNYCWSGDEKYWSGRNPILFPQVGHNEDKTIKINGIKYPIGNHGFARHSIFDVVSQSDNSLTLQLKENAETLACYPFKFLLQVKYTLIGKELNIEYHIKNTGIEDMPFGFGLHPAFACKDDYQMTKIVFDKEENRGKELIINKEVFEKEETVVIEKPVSEKATLVTGDRAISIEYHNYNVLGIWSKGNFVCIEPWINQTPSDPEIELKDRKDNIILSANQSIDLSYKWIIEK